jgi:hypothetical protein
MILYRLAFRFLEVDDEYFNYSVADVPQQGQWDNNGSHLPNDILQKLYFSYLDNLYVLK